MSDTKIGTILDGTEVFAAGLDRARQLMTAKDAFIANQSRFDRQSRMRLPKTVEEVTLDQYLTFLRTNVRPWSDAELQGLADIFKAIRTRFQRLRMRLPKAVYLVKTSGQEEGFSAYTRHDNTIVMSETKVALMAGGGGDALHPQPDVAALQNIYIHECFHLLSKNNPDIRHKLYAEVGYVQFDRGLTLPEKAVWAGEPMAQMKITNPDTPVLNVAIDLVPPDDPGGAAVPMMPVLLAKRDYTSGIFFEYLDWVFLRVERRGADWSIPVDSSGQPYVVQASDKGIMRQYMAKVGHNITEEIFHPDEILAQNFVLVINEPSLHVLQGIARAVHHPASEN